jgi:hypothetical protein
LETTITLSEGKGCEATIEHYEMTVRTRECVTWKVVNNCSQARTVMLRELQLYVTGNLRADDVPGNGGEGWIEGRARRSTADPNSPRPKPRKYDVHIPGGGTLDPYIVIEDVKNPEIARALAIAAGLGVGYLTYRAVQSMIRDSVSSRQLNP